MMSFSNLDSLCCVRIPSAALAHLAPLRTRPEVLVLEKEGWWVYWPAEEDDLLRQMLGLPGAEWFTLRGGSWYRPGARLPTFTVPDPTEARPLVGILTPAPVAPALPADSIRPVPLALVRGGAVGPATAVECTPADLARWAECATTHQLQSLQAAWCPGEGEGRVLLVGPRVPPLPGGSRYRGETVFLPLGYDVVPAVGEGALRELLSLVPGERALLRPDGAEVIPAEAFAPLTRAAARRLP